MGHKEIFNKETEKYIKPLHRTAVTAALGSFAFFKCEIVGDTKLKYTRVTSDEEIEAALAYVAEYGLHIPTVQSIRSLPKKVDEVPMLHYFVVEKVAPDHRYFESLTARSVGPISQKVEVEQTSKVLHVIAEEASARRASASVPTLNAPITSPFSPWKTTTE